MLRRPRPSTLRPAAPQPAAGPASGPVAAIRTATEVAHLAFRDALLELGRPHAGDDRLPGAERDAWECREPARDEVYAAAAGYVRALRRDGLALPAALVTVRAVVRQEAACWLLPAEYAAVQRDAARCCLEAFYAH